jgi:hypothetical protein
MVGSSRAEAGITPFASGTCRTSTPPPIILRNDGDVFHLAAAPNGRVALGLNGTVHVWDIDLPRMLELAGQVAGRNLTDREWRQFIGPSQPRPTFDKIQ